MTRVQCQVGVIRGPSRMAESGRKGIRMLLDELKVNKDLRAEIMGGTAEKLVGLR